MTENAHREHAEADLRASLRRFVNGEPRRCVPANFDYDDDLILDMAISELIALRKTLPATLNDEGWSVTLVAPADCYVFMPRPGWLKVTVVPPGPPAYSVEYTDYDEYLAAWRKRYRMGGVGGPLTHRDLGDEQPTRARGGG